MNTKKPGEMKNDKSVSWALFTTNFGRSAVSTLELYKDGQLGNIEIGFVLYENLPSGAAELAQEMNINTIRVIKSDFKSRDLYEKHLVKILLENQIDFVFLLGFSYFLKHDLINKYEGRLINIHPSLLPSFPGKRAIQQALEYGVRITGITTHYIDKELDKGRIIDQVPIEINNEEVFNDLDQKFLTTAKPLLKNTIKIVGENYSKSRTT